MLTPQISQPPIAPGDGIAFFGSCIWEVSSCWFKLFLASLLREAAPPCHLYKKGERVKQLPDEFLRYSFVKITKWDNEHSVVARGSALHNINDLLLSSPVLVQPYPSAEPPMLRVAFPLAAEAPLAESPKQWTLENAHLHPSVQILVSELSLATDCGYIELVDMGEAGFLCFDVLFGLPLFDDAVAKKILQLMETRQLLNNIDKHKASSLSLASRLKHFISSVGAEEAVQGSLPLPLSNDVV